MKTPAFSPCGDAALRPAATIRRAVSSNDYSTCADIWLAASLAGHDFVPAGFWRGQRAAMAERYLPSARVLLLAAKGEPAAFAATIHGDAPCLAALFVLPHWWGKGFGRQLLERVLADIPDQKNVGLRCAVYEKNSRALAFYAHRGFRPTGRSICQYTNEPQIELLCAAANTVHDNAAAIRRP